MSCTLLVSNEVQLLRSSMQQVPQQKMNCYNVLMCR